MIWRLATLLICLAGPMFAAECRKAEHLSNGYSVCEVDLTKEELRLFLKEGDDSVHGYFTSVNSSLKLEDKKLGFAMNAGMYHEDRDPVGHYVEDGVQEMRVISSDGPGNFGLLPNGIFCTSDLLRVYETLDFIAQAPDCTYATQSGPMLVINGALHPRFIETSDSLNIRNGVGTTADGTAAVFAISNDAVNFHNFGTFFRDHLDVPNALFFDGKISRLYAPSLNRSDFGWQLGPIVGVLDATTPAN